MSTVLPATFPDRSHLAVAGFLARYREPTAGAYRRDLRCFWQWCADRDLSPLAAKRPTSSCTYATSSGADTPPPPSADGCPPSPAFSSTPSSTSSCPPTPTLAVTRPGVPWEGQRRTVLHPLEFAAVLSAARQHSATAHALVAMLGMHGLRVSEAFNAQIEELRYAGPAEGTLRPPSASSASSL